MKPKFLIIDEEVIKDLLEVDKLEYDFEEEIVFNEWKLDLFRIDTLDCDVVALFKKSELSFEYLFSMIQNSNDVVEIGVASLFIYYIDFDNKDENRERVIDYLTTLSENGDESSRLEIKTIVWESKLYSPINRRSVIGKSYSEVQADAGYFRDLSERANKLVK